MTLRLYNSLGREKQTFTPIDPLDVRMYVCGPTVYDYAHIGNARPAVVFDLLFRLLREEYGQDHVRYLRNLTDIDDKIIQKSQTSGTPISDITTHFTAIYQQDMAALNVLEPTVQPKATDHIPDMISMIESLLARDHAYVAEGHVLFSVPSMETYGALSRRDREDMIAGARVEIAPYKQDPADFILWKPSDATQPGWESPWGRGRPGWHIECSAMSYKHFGAHFDIHGGGADLTFPHHENEIAQSCCAHNSPYVNYWMHNGYLIVEGEKMSKSLGNFFTVHDLLADWPGEVLRFYMLGTHYRQPLNWQAAEVQKSRDALERVYLALRDVADIDAQPQKAPESVLEALRDDLNSPAALAAFHELVTQLNKAQSPEEKAQAKGQLRAAGAVLGIAQQDPLVWLQGPPKENQEAAITAAEIEKCLQDRQTARKEKNFAEADRLRDLLISQGILLEDGPNGTQWRRG